MKHFLCQQYVHLIARDRVNGSTFIVKYKRKYIILLFQFIVQTVLFEWLSLYVISIRPGNVLDLGRWLALDASSALVGSGGLAVDTFLMMR